MGSFTIALTGSLLYIFLGKSYPDAVPFMLLLGKFGLSGAFNLVYIANSIFPTIYSTTTIGICSIFARAATIFAPMMAELPDPIPMIIFSVLSGLPIFLSFFLNVKKQS